MGRARVYRPFANWADWLEGAAYVQANRKEAACMLSRPRIEPSMEELNGLARMILQGGSLAVFFTLGLDGVLAVTSHGDGLLSPGGADLAVDTTGCGDVFAAGTSFRLIHGENPAAAASFGLKLASCAACMTGVEKVYDLARRLGRQCLDPA